MINDDYSIGSLEHKYGEVTAEKLATMTNEERGEYYAAMYQYFGRMIGIVHEVKPNETALDSAEYHTLSAVNNSFMAVVDGLAALVEIAAITTDQPGAAFGDIEGE